MSALTDIRETDLPAQLSVGDVTFSYRQGGTGAPLVLLHGIGSNAGSWRDQLEGLADLRRVIAWDAPGYGASTPLAAARPLANDYAERLKLLLEGLRLVRRDVPVTVRHPERTIATADHALPTPGWKSSLRPIRSNKMFGLSRLARAIRIEL